MAYRILADLVVVLHATYIAFVLFGLLLIVLGGVLRWGWVRNFWFRAIHLAMITIVVVQALVGVACPLTTLESCLRVRSGSVPYPGSFIAYWVHQLIFFEAASWVFALCYSLFGLLVLLGLVLVPPRWPGGSRGCRR